MELKRVIPPLPTNLILLFVIIIMSSNNNAVIKVGIIGTGIFAYRHLRAYQAVGQFEVVACANRSLEKAQKFAKEASKPSTPFLHHTLTQIHTHTLSLFFSFILGRDS